MQAFTNTEHTKESAVALAQWHQDQDGYIKGIYGNATPSGWKGCSVGCMAKGRHKDYPALFGIDVRVAYLSDRLFESVDDYKNWTARFFESIKTGSDTTIAYYRFMHWMLTNDDHSVIRQNQHKSICLVGRLFERAMNGDLPSKEAWRAAAAAAYSAADAADADTCSAASAYSVADAATYSAAYSAAAYSAAAAATCSAAAAAASASATYSASSAAATYSADATYSVADAAAAAATCSADAAAAAAAYPAATYSVAAAAARKKHYKIMADKLCYFLGGAGDVLVAQGQKND